MKIDKLYLKNFRNIEEAHYEFPTNFTVIIGMNGAGKSTILHALRVAAGAYLMGVPTSQVKNLHISKDEVRMTNNKFELLHHPVIIEAAGGFPEKSTPVIWRRRILKEGGSNTSSIKDVGAIRNLSAKKYAKMKEEGTDELDLPLIAYFGTNRVFGTARKKNKPRTGRKIFKEGYHDWLNMRSSTYQYTNWLSTYDALVKNGKEYAESKEIFFQTIKTACPYVIDVDFIIDRLWLRTKMNDRISDLLPLALKSDGIVTFVEMVAELAYRCIVLNGYLKEKAILESRGVVLIDEMDLHLHPKWQEHVVNDLKTAFPQMQFIVTTHSPVIVQSLETEELINLNDDTLSGLEDDPFKYSLEEVISSEMGLDQERRSQKFLEMQAAAAEFFDLVQDETNEEKITLAQEKLEQLQLRYHNEPAYVALLKSELPKK